jgi:uncharacterized membrane protein YeaQ/YmgE (transglycosylase-associated protein family)
MLSLFVFAVIGLLAGSAARLFYPGRQPLHILGTLLLGMIGALAGGMFSWNYWPALEDQFDAGNLLLSTLGAVALILAWAGYAYKRNLAGPR